MSLVGALQAPATTSVVAGSIVYEPIGCMVAGQFPLIEAVIEPSAAVARARVYFKSALRSEYYFVEMTLQEGKLVGKLPAPPLKASSITYYIQTITTEGVEGQSEEVEARVVSDASQCPEGARVASIGPPGGVTVFSAMAIGDYAPIGFSGPTPWVRNLQIGVPQKASLTVGRVFAVERWCDDMCGVLVAVEPGVGGGNLSVGVSKGSGGASVVSRAAKVTVLRTWNPWSAADRSTYLGVELTGSLGFRPGLAASFGVLRRVSGTAGSRNWIVTAGIGLGM